MNDSDRFELLGSSAAVWLVLGLLVGMSILTWWVALHRGVVIWRARRALSQDADALAAAADLAGAAPRLRIAHPIARRVLEAGDAERQRLTRLPRADRPAGAPAEPVQRALNEAAHAELHRLAGALPAMGTAAAVSPLLGLFGTVWGIAHTFLAAHRTGTATLAALAPGVAEALVTTIAGLTVAIPATFFHNALLRQHAAAELHLGRLIAAYLNRLPAGLPATAAPEPEGQRDTTQTPAW